MYKILLVCSFTCILILPIKPTDVTTINGIFLGYKCCASFCRD